MCKSRVTSIELETKLDPSRRPNVALYFIPLLSSPQMTIADSRFGHMKRLFPHNTG
jgi:hypothetical protein